MRQRECAMLESTAPARGWPRARQAGAARPGIAASSAAARTPPEHKTAVRR